jgi:3-dehydroquinate synthase
LERLSVRVPGHDYDVVVGSGLLGGADELLPPIPGAERAFVVADHTVAAAYLEPLADALSRRWRPVHLGVPAGEEAKTAQTLLAILRQLAVQEAHRADVMVALGGGAVGDLAGFAAATYMRGMPFVPVPTTLTAQVDASIGGKTAVNLPEGKNLVGAFHQPTAVLADVATLVTLPVRDYRSGLAEVAKYALTLDADLLERLEADPAPVLSRRTDALEALVARCVRCKAAVVGEDERDAGRRLVLNYGHTLGHALERLDAFAGRSHGEAITAGMVFAARLSESLARAPAGLAARHVRLFSSLGLDAGAALPPLEEVLSAMRLDKKYREGMRFVLLEDVGRPVIASDVPEDVVRQTLAAMGAP